MPDIHNIYIGPCGWIGTLCFTWFPLRGWGAKVSALDKLLYCLVHKGCQVASAAALDWVLYTLAFRFKMWGEVDTKNFVVHQVLKGIHRVYHTRLVWRPVTLLLLERMFGFLSTICSLPYAILWFPLAFSLAYYGAFQISELVNWSCALLRDMLVQNVQVQDGVLLMILPRSKTNQEGKGCLIELYWHDGSLTCPV